MAQVKEPKIKSRTLKLREGNVVLYLKPKKMEWKDFEEKVELAANDYYARFGINTVVIGVERYGDVRICDEKEMDFYGWVRKDRVFMFKEDVKFLPVVDGPLGAEEEE